MATKKVYIFEHVCDDGSVEYRVYPPVVVLTNGDKLEFDNRTGVDWDWAGPAYSLKVKKTANWKVDSSRLQKREYACTMTTSDGRRAKGLSDPMIIIDP